MDIGCTCLALYHLLHVAYSVTNSVNTTSYYCKNWPIHLNACTPSFLSLKLGIYNSLVSKYGKIFLFQFLISQNSPKIMSHKFGHHPLIIKTELLFLDSYVFWYITLRIQLLTVKKTTNTCLKKLHKSLFRNYMYFRTDLFAIWNRNLWNFFYDKHYGNVTDEILRKWTDRSPVQIDLI